MKGMVKVSLVGGALVAMPASYYMLSNNSPEPKEYSGFESNSFSATYGNFSSFALGLAVTGYMLNNAEYIYSLMLALIALMIFRTFGLTGLESLFCPNAEQLIIQA